jgi:hypothetical protein
MSTTLSLRRALGEAVDRLPSLAGKEREVEDLECRIGELERAEQRAAKLARPTGGGFLVQVDFSVAIFMLALDMGDILSGEELSKPGAPPHGVSGKLARAIRARARTDGSRVRVPRAFSIARREGRGTWRRRGIQLGVGCFDRAAPHEAKCHLEEAYRAAATVPGTGA